MRIFQQFDLRLQDIALDQTYIQNLTPAAHKQLIEGLEEKGYQILEGLSATGGVPHSIIIGSSSTEHKPDFYKLAEEAGLKFEATGNECYDEKYAGQSFFRSGDCYVSHD